MVQVAREQLRGGRELPSMRDLAQLSGVGIGTVYRHFPTRRALLETLGTDGMERLVAACCSAADDPDPVSGFERIVGFVLRGQLEDPGIAAVLTDPENGHRAMRPLATDLAAAVEQLLTRARAAGAIRPDVTADDIRRLLVGLAHAAGPQVRVDDRRVQLYLQILLDGLRSTAP